MALAFWEGIFPSPINDPPNSRNGTKHNCRCSIFILFQFDKTALTLPPLHLILFIMIVSPFFWGILGITCIYNILSVYAPKSLKIPRGGYSTPTATIVYSWRDFCSKHQNRYDSSTTIVSISPWVPSGPFPILNITPPRFKTGWTACKFISKTLPGKARDLFCHIDKTAILYIYISCILPPRASSAQSRTAAAVSTSIAIYFPNAIELTKGRRSSKTHTHTSKTQ